MHFYNFLFDNVVNKNTTNKTIILFTYLNTFQFIDYILYMIL